MMCIYKHCFPPMLLVFAMKCCTKMPCPLPHNHYCRLLSSPVCLPHLLICTCLISSPIACPPSSVLCWCLLRFFFVFFLYMLHFFVTPFWIVCVYIFNAQWQSWCGTQNVIYNGFLSAIIITKTINNHTTTKNVIHCEMRLFVSLAGTVHLFPSWQSFGSC